MTTKNEMTIKFLERRLHDETEHAYYLAQEFAGLPTDRIHAWDTSRTELRQSLNTIENLKQLITRLS